MKIIFAFLLAFGVASHADEVVCGKKVYCSQMKSCEEAMAYLKKCPNQVKIDGDGDGIPCEKQHCGHLKKHSFLNLDSFKKSEISHNKNS